MFHFIFKATGCRENLAQSCRPQIFSFPGWKLCFWVCSHGGHDPDVNLCPAFSTKKIIALPFPISIELLKLKVLNSWATHEREWKWSEFPLLMLTADPNGISNIILASFSYRRKPIPPDSIARSIQCTLIGVCMARELALTSRFQKFFLATFPWTSQIHSSSKFFLSHRFLPLQNSFWIWITA